VNAARFIVDVMPREVVENDADIPILSTHLDVYYFDPPRKVVQHLYDKD
jgi:hypothetical protein